MKSRVVNCRLEPHDVYVGRGAGKNHIWGNPFSHLEKSAASPEFLVASRAEAIERYETWLLAQPELVARARDELRGKVLGCWCSPKACHGNVLARVANEWPTPNLDGVICFDVETDARKTPRTRKLGVQPLVCMAYALSDDDARLVGVDEALNLWLDWMRDDSVRFLVHAGYSDMAVMAQAAYLRAEGKDCDLGDGWAYELVFRAYEAGRIIDTEIRQRLTQIAFGPSKGAAALTSIVSRTFEVDLGDSKKVPIEAEELLESGIAWEDWPRDIFDMTPWRVKYGALQGRPIHTWPQDAQEYPKGDVLWPRRIYRHQHDRWQGGPIPDERRQTDASWDLFVLSRPGWAADKPRAERIRALYETARTNCHRRLVADGVIRQKVIHKGKENERIDESVSTARVKQLVFQALGEETPLAEKAQEALAGRAPTPEERLAGASRSAGTVRKAIISAQAKVLDVVDAIDQARGGPEVFDAWLANSRSPTLNAFALNQKATTYITNFLNRLASDDRIRTTYQTLVDTGRVSCLAGWVQIETPEGPKPIADIRVGDFVRTHKQRWRRVTETWTKGVQPMLDVKLSNGFTFTATAEHKVLTINTEGLKLWGPVETLEVGRAFWYDSTHDLVRVESVEPVAPSMVYDITVDEDESYEACGVFHHNSRKINVQQLPRDADKPAELSIRGCIVPDPGWVFLVADYSQLELCALAHILSVMVRRRTGDPTYESSLSKAINSGKDCHVLMAATLLGRPYEVVSAIRERAEAKKKKGETLTAEEKSVLDHRQIAKAANFGYPGGQGPRTYIEYAAGYGLTLTLEQATRARDAFTDTWVEMPEYFEMMSQACKKGNGTTTLRQLYSGRLRGDCYFTRACNGMFQSLAADGAKEALHLIIHSAYRDPTSPLYGTRPSGFVHDEFIVSCRKEQAERALPELERLMVLGMSKWIPDVLIQAPGKIMTERWSK